IHFQRQKPELRGSYYVHLEPGNQSFIAVGFWNPHSEDLHRVRKEWEIDADEIREILNLTELKKSWGKLYGESLKTAPRGFDKKHPAIDLINLKQWLFSRSF